ncbi:MAG: hypothetical protein WKG00_26960 [Polyangiaceae bacterium]
MTGRVMWRTLSMVQVPSASPRPHGRAALRPAVAASLVLHALVLLLAVRGRLAVGGERVAAPAPPADTAADVWAGDTPLPGSGQLIDIDTQPGSAVREGAAAPDQAGAPPRAPAVPEPAPARPAKVDAPEAPKRQPSAVATPPPTAKPRTPPAARSKVPPKPSASVDPLAAALAGGSRAAARAVERAHAVQDDGADGPRPGRPEAGASAPPASQPACATSVARSPAPSAGGERRPDLGQAPVGPAGRYRVVVSVDASGHITGHSSSDREPPRHLVELVERTVAQLESGTFALRGQVGAGTQALVLSVVLRDEPAEAADATRGLNLAFEYDGSRGKASFTQAGGRRVEVTLRVEPPTRAP